MESLEQPLLACSQLQAFERSSTSRSSPSVTSASLLTIEEKRVSSGSWLRRTHQQASEIKRETPKSVEKQADLEAVVETSKGSPRGDRAAQRGIRFSISRGRRKAASRYFIEEKR
jgi:hypothetical protein